MIHVNREYYENYAMACQGSPDAPQDLSKGNRGYPQGQ